MSESEQTARRVIKRYSNRKLYDTKDSRYVTLQQIGEMVRQGEDVQIIDNKTKEDKTEVTLALILSEDLKNKPRSVPLATLRTLIQERGEKLIDSLRTTPLGRLIPVEREGEEGSDVAAGVASTEGPVSQSEATTDAGDGHDKPKAGRLDELRNNIDQLQAHFDERLKAMLPASVPVRQLLRQVEALSERVDALEKQLAGEPKPKGEQKDQ